MDNVDQLLASVARKMLAPGTEVYLDIRNYGMVVDGTVYGLTDDEERAVLAVIEGDV